MRRGRRTPSDPAGFTPASVGVRSRPFIFFRSRSAAAAACRIGLALRESRPVSGRKFHSFFRGGKALTADFSLELLIPKGLSLRRVPNRTRPDSVRASSFARPFRRASASLFYSLCRAVAKIGNCRDGRRTGVVIKIGAAGANERTIIRKSKCSTDFKRNDFLKKTKRTHWVRFVHLNSLIESCVFLYLWNSPFDTFL